MKYKGKITITLKSDLCVGSGYAYAGIVDSDICYDKNGVPFIPGKRLKGCFRETANSYLYCLYDDKFLSKLFGERGQKESSKLTIGNAYIIGYDKISPILQTKIRQNPEKFNQQSILEQYSRVIGQTKLTESGSAEKGSLRYTRVVNHYAPGAPFTELSFEACISADMNNQEKEALEKIIKATKNIGLKRNRGLGSISIKTDLKEEECEAIDFRIEGSEELYFISYAVINKDPLVLSGESSDDSENHILGSNVIGALAGRYLSMDGTSAKDEAFKDLFLNGKVIFSNLYPSDEGKVFYPAPEYICSMKKSEKIVNIIEEYEKDRIESITEENEETKEYSRRNGNQPKKLKGKFVNLDSTNKIAIMEVGKEVVYHHSHYISNIDGTQGLLYAMEVISPDQIFAGKIITPEKYKNMLISLLKTEEFYFGKSKTAQYGRCELVGEPIVEKLKKTEKVYKSGDKIIVTLKSDAIFMNDEGAYTVYSDEVSGLIANELGISDAKPERDQTYVKTGKVSGYMSVWNLRKPCIPTMKAGSALVYTLKSDIVLPEEVFIGERCLEGYGQIVLNRASDMHYKMEMNKDIKQENLEDISIEGSAKGLCDEIENEYWLSEKKLEFIGKKIPIRNTAGLGRVTLMLKESLVADKCYEEQFKAFSERIESISEKNKLRKQALAVLEMFGTKENGIWKFTWLSEEQFPKDICEKRRSYWGECLMSLLVASKYDHKEG
ncbi:MAG: hypothetical protein J6O73_05425 [Lachnospiraceae bacterium]|nr:hypothetical protein [Lachnospiraceae bacterium]